jgi:hypothetical protein
MLVDLEEMDNYVGSQPTPSPQHLEDGCMECRSLVALRTLVEFAQGVERLTQEAFKEAQEYKSPEEDATVDAADLRSILRVLTGG